MVEVAKLLWFSLLLNAPFKQYGCPLASLAGVAGQPGSGAVRCAVLPCNDAAATWFNGAENAGGRAGRRGAPLSGVEAQLAWRSLQLVTDVREREQETKGREEKERERQRQTEVSHLACRDHRKVTLCRRQLCAKSSRVHSRVGAPRALYSVSLKASVQISGFLAADCAGRWCSETLMWFQSPAMIPLVDWEPAAILISSCTRRTKQQPCRKISFHSTCYGDYLKKLNQKKKTLTHFFGFPLFVFLNSTTELWDFLFLFFFLHKTFCVAVEFARKPRWPQGEKHCSTI